MKALEPIYSAPTINPAAQTPDEFEPGWGSSCEAIVELWRRHWGRFIPFRDFDLAIRKIA